MSPGRSLQGIPREAVRIRMARGRTFPAVRGSHTKIQAVMARRHLYKVIFVNQGKVYEIYARSVGQGDLFGFVAVEQLVFGERTTVVVDPSEERLKAEFETVKRTHIPMHAVIRIDEVEKQGASKISAIDGSNVSPFPMYTPGGPGGGSGRDS